MQPEIQAVAHLVHTQITQESKTKSTFYPFCNFLKLFHKYPQGKFCDFSITFLLQKIPC